MQFETGRIYHIFNQGNNRRKIFFKRENYPFFLKKIRLNILPYSDILAWCLMPNHFHLMVLVNHLELNVENTHRVTSSHPVSPNPVSNNPRTFNQSIAIMLRSYTRAINKQQKTSGALFRESTKAECVNCIDGITPSFLISQGITYINHSEPEKQYPQFCFDYIHNNPIKAGLVNDINNWEFSSASDYYGIRNGTLINKSVTKEYLNF